MIAMMASAELMFSFSPTGGLTRSIFFLYVGNAFWVNKRKADLISPKDRLDIYSCEDLFFFAIDRRDSFPADPSYIVHW